MSGAQRSACVARDDLADLLDPGLRGARLEAFQAHIEECVVCRREVRDLAAGFARLRVEGDASGTQVRSSARMPAASVAPPAPPSAGSELAHYELGREIARGGMGRIVEAWDLRHQRPVALKMLLRNGASAMRRFAREVEITAHLQHPAIIPLYEAGRCPTGEPFFAMKRVEGRPLSEVITRAHDLRSRVALLPQLIAVSEALAYAHEQGIVHRDLKPANVLIGAFGEAVVIDWGLAKAIDASESAREIPVELPAGGEPLTVAGAAMGTPGYMPPEQARGAPVDERSDVYALGALLYHVFSGVPPYSGPSPSGVIERVLQEPPRRLREAVPELAPDLAAIVDKAMARDPAQRYPDAGELARDLRRFEAGQLVTARSYTQPELVRRWLARRRAVVTTAAVLVIALLATATLSFRRIVRERDRADAARQAAVTQRDAAEKVVGFVIGDLRTRLEPLGRLDVLSSVGAKVEDYYRAISTPDEADLGVLERRGAALGTLSDVADQKHELDGALSMSRSAVALRERALSLAPGDPEAKAQLVENLIQLGHVEWELATFDRAGVSYGKARDLAAELVAKGGSARWLALLASAEIKLAHVARDTGDRPGAETRYRRGIELYEKAVAADPHTGDYAYGLSRAHFNLADFEADPDPGSALRDYDACVQILEKLQTSDPSNLVWRARLGDCLTSRGREEGGLGRWEAALADERAGEQIRGSLSRGDPDNRNLLRNYADSTLWLCKLLGALDRFSEATVWCEKTLGIDEGLAAGVPDNAVAQEDLASNLFNVAQVDLERGDPQRASERLARSVAIGEAEWKKHPDMEPWRRRVCRYHRDLAKADLALGKLDAAEAERSRAKAILDASPHDDENWRNHRAEIQVVGAQIAHARGDDAGAVAMYRDAVAIYEALEAGPVQRGRRVDFAGALGALGELLGRTPASRAEGRAMIARAVAILEAIGAHDPLAPVEERDLARLRKGMPGG